MFVIREWSIRTNYVHQTPPLVNTSGDSLRSEGTFHSFAFCQRFARVFLHTSLFVARTYNVSWQCPNLEHKCSGIFCLVACERPVVPPGGSKFVFQRVTARFCCSSSLRCNVNWFMLCPHRHFGTPRFTSRVEHSFSGSHTFKVMFDCFCCADKRISHHVGDEHITTLVCELQALCMRCKRRRLCEVVASRFTQI